MMVKISLLMNPTRGWPIYGGFIETSVDDPTEEHALPCPNP